MSPQHELEGVTNCPPRWMKSACEYHCLETRGGRDQQIHSRLGVPNASSDELHMCAYSFATVCPEFLPHAGISSPCRSGDEPMVVPDTHADWRFAKNVRQSLFRKVMDLSFSWG